MTRGRRKRRCRGERTETGPSKTTTGGGTKELQCRGHRTEKRRSRRARTPPRPRRDVAQPESRFFDPYDNDHKDIGNPGGRIPDSLTERHGDEDAISIIGNPDIRVPKVMRRDNGLCARGALRPEDAEKDRAAERGRKPDPARRPPEEEPKNSSVEDTAPRKEDPEERQLHHVPGGTWLNQSLPSPVTGNPEEEEDNIESITNRPQTLDIVTVKLDIIKPRLRTLSIEYHSPYYRHAHCHSRQCCNEGLYVL
ncbi:hypothetical protein NDU88_004929 [Pleurodeles waltl]|uniref:Uncharacterized protein n=1 Tax=Pleurodeles waltl TaxID=8319 RepID=A0AAV7W6D5_PLEWA|nr:hypothetical protein NDU88_004929 [Pleurodeles waltl]